MAIVLAGTHTGGSPIPRSQLTSSATSKRVRAWAESVGATTVRTLAADYQALVSQGPGGSGAEACSAIDVMAGYALRSGGPPAPGLRRPWLGDLRLVSAGAAACRQQVGADDRQTATGPVEKVARGVGGLLALEQAAGHGRLVPAPARH